MAQLTECPTVQVGLHALFKIGLVNKVYMYSSGSEIGLVNRVSIVPICLVNKVASGSEIGLVDRKSMVLIGLVN